MSTCGYFVSSRGIYWLQSYFIYLFNFGRKASKSLESLEFAHFFFFSSGSHTTKVSTHNSLTSFLKQNKKKRNKLSHIHKSCLNLQTDKRKQAGGGKKRRSLCDYGIGDEWQQGPRLTETKLWPPVPPIKFSRREQFTPLFGHLAILMVKQYQIFCFPHYTHEKDKDEVVISSLRRGGCQ